MNTSEIKLGKLISNNQGHCRGPKYGQVFTAAVGEKGYVAGYRSTANEGLGLMGVKQFSLKKDALDYAVQVSDY